MREFDYEPDPTVPLSVEVVAAIAKAHNEDIIDQEWRISDEINTDALDGLFQDHNHDITLQFTADTASVTINADESENPVITIESHQ